MASISEDLAAWDASNAPEPPRPLMREIPPADPFPVGALGDVLGAAATAINDRVQAPIAICGQSVLAAAALAVQGHADVELPIGEGSLRPASCFFVTVAATGERKTECDRQAGWPVEKREAALREKHAVHVPDFVNDKLAWDRARERAIKSGNGNRAAIKDALDRIGPPPPPPLEPMLTCPEPTFEGLCKLFAAGHPSLGVFSAEGGGFIGGHGMSEESKLRTAAGLSEIWDGRAIRRVRAGDGSMILPGRRLSLHLMAQPGVADILFRDRALLEQGLLSRVLVTAPDSTSGTRFYREENPETSVSIRRYGARLLSILETPLPLRAGTQNELEPRRLVLSDHAKRKWIRFHEHIERELKPNGELDEIRGLANKLPEHAARIAAILALVQNLDAGDISLATMSAGIALAEHYSAEARRLFGTAKISEAIKAANEVLRWLCNSWPEPAVSLVDIYQRGPPAGAREKDGAAKIVATLEDHGFLIKLPQGAIIGGERRKDAWRIVRVAPWPM